MTSLPVSWFPPDTAGLARTAHRGILMGSLCEHLSAPVSDGPAASMKIHFVWETARFLKEGFLVFHFLNRETWQMS